MNGPGGAAFGLQLAHNRRHAPNVLLIFRRPFIGKFTHWRRWRDGIDRDYFVGFMSNVSSGFVAIDGYHFVSHFPKQLLLELKNLAAGGPRPDRLRRTRESFIMMT